MREQHKGLRISQKSTRPGQDELCATAYHDPPSVHAPPKLKDGGRRGRAASAPSSRVHATGEPSSACTRHLRPGGRHTQSTMNHALERRDHADHESARYSRRPHASRYSNTSRISLHPGPRERDGRPRCSNYKVKEFKRQIAASVFLAARWDPTWDHFRTARRRGSSILMVETRRRDRSRYCRPTCSTARPAPRLGQGQIGAAQAWLLTPTSSPCAILRSRISTRWARFVRDEGRRGRENRTDCYGSASR